MKKYFVVSDIHSFFTQFKKGLYSAGFNESNPDHCIIICGDIFDRGKQSVDLFNWLDNFPKDRIILIRGNHELLYLELLAKDYPEKHDYSNGTVRTFCALAGCSESLMDPYSIMFENQLFGSNITPDIIEKRMHKNWNKIKRAVRKHPATELIQSSRFLNYLELDKFIFVHSFIPTRIKDEYAINMLKYYPTYVVDESLLEPLSDWRNASSVIWEDATWGCPWRQFNAGLFDNEIARDKILVCGHWHCRDFHKNLGKKVENIDEIFVSEHLIALDSCIPVSCFCNVLVIDFDARKLFNQDNEQIGEF